MKAPMLLRELRIQQSCPFPNSSFKLCGIDLVALTP